MSIPTVFISSTSEDLRAYRQMARDAAQLCGFRSDMMEYFVAGSRPPLPECMRRVDQADLVVVIVAHRLGWIPDGQGVPDAQRKSITWLECQRALDAGKEVLAFLMDDALPWPAESREEYGATQALLDNRLTPALMAELQWRVQRLKEFKTEISSGRIVSRFTTPDSLQGPIIAALHEWRARHPQFAPAATAAAPCDPSAYLRAWPTRPASSRSGAFRSAAARPACSRSTSCTSR